MESLYSQLFLFFSPLPSCSWHTIGLHKTYLNVCISSYPDYHPCFEGCPSEQSSSRRSKWWFSFLERSCVPNQTQRSWGGHPLSVWCPFWIILWEQPRKGKWAWAGREPGGACERSWDRREDRVRSDTPKEKKKRTRCVNLKCTEAETC